MRIATRPVRVNRRRAIVGGLACIGSLGRSLAEVLGRGTDGPHSAASLASRLVAGDDPRLMDDFGGGLEQRLPNRLVPRAVVASALPGPAHEHGLSHLTYRHEGTRRTIDDYLAAQRVTGLLAVQGDAALFERYANGGTPASRFLSASMAKSILGLLIGIAVEEGSIKSIDQLAQHYVPALSGSPYGDTSIRDLLQMSSGIRFEEAYSGQDDLSALMADTIGQRSAGGAAALRPYRERRAPAGRLFYYSSADTQALGLVLRAATGVPVADFLASRLWQPMGAESDASYLIDASGQEATFAFLHATLRDYGRVGRLLAQGGAWNGRVIVPPGWLRQATDGTAPHRQAHVASSYFGYGYQFWTFPGPERRFAMLGVRGQAIFVDPGLRLALVQTAVWKTAGDRAARAELLALWQGLIEACGGR